MYARILILICRAYKVYSDSTLVLNGTSMNSIGALLILSRGYTKLFENGKSRQICPNLLKGIV